MDSEHSSFDKEQREFYKEASKMIYGWLPIDKRDKLGQEIASEGLLGLGYLGDQERFFRLLNFLDTNYVKIGQWMERTIERVSKLTLPEQKNEVMDIEIEFAEEKKIRLSAMLAEYSKYQIEPLFLSTLKELELFDEYKHYIDERQRGGKYE